MKGVFGIRFLLISSRNIEQKPELFFLDSTSVKAHVSVAGARKSEGDQGIGKSKGGTTSKIHMIAAGPDEGMEFSITGGEVSDIKAGLHLISSAKFSEAL